MRCERSRSMAATLDEPVDELVERHLVRCRSCRHEREALERVRGLLSELAGRRRPVDEQLLADILAALDRCDERTARTGRTAACLGGLAAAGALVLAGRRLHVLSG